jgi:hypothetical protein
LSRQNPAQLTEQVIRNAILIALVSSALRMERDESMYIERIITYVYVGPRSSLGYSPIAGACII